ncbi:MAG TPA: 50S ribosomal protein L11 methyltransferase [Lichenihabitans sp.]|nr:50S ribosomal protein L11 methyltransferase [Lichenihabitans sp.]
MLEGLPPNDAASLLRLVCDEAAARRAADAIVELLDPAESAAAAFEDEASPLRPRPWVLEIYLAPKIDASMVRELLAPVIGDDMAGRLVSETVAEQDWIAKALDGLSPVRAGRFLVHGRHGRAAVEPNDLALEIEAALAFGTGHHGTTRGCLLALDRVLKRRRPRRILDLGTGTGVLAMAAAKALKRPVRCGDLDAVAVEAAAANARLNGVAAFVRPVVAAGLGHPALRHGAPYDLIFANILARPLRGLAPSIAAHAAPGADLVLSGLLPADVAGILSAYGPQGFRLERRRDLEGWATLMLRKA